MKSKASMSTSLNERASKPLVSASARMRPSEFLNQSLVDCPVDDYPMIVEFMNIKDNTAQVHSTVDIDKPIFSPSPTALIFEDYAPFAVHEKKLFFRNRDKVARRIKIMQTDSPFFEVTAPRNVNGQPLKQSKIAAGMEVCFIVKFKPQEVRDYTLDLVCVTEREKFLVPVRAIGERPRMSFPDEIQFGSCPVKSTSRKMVLAQNVGSSVATFRLFSQHPSITCSSEDMIVEPGGSQMIEIFFTPTGSEIVEADIEIEFTKKIKCYMGVKGSGKNVDVSLSTPAVTMEPSFISLSSQQTLRIHNHSEISIKFSWKSFGSRYEEEEERARLHAEITRMEELEEEELLDAAANGDFGSVSQSYDQEDIFDSDFGLSFDARAAKATLIRKYRNLRKALEHDQMHFVDDIFEITPVEGTVWAKSEIEITVSFRPDTAAAYSCLAFLDISGREDRLPLQLSGTGIGPHAGLSFDIFDIGDVFINSPQNYEVIISNKGDIPAEWSLIPSTSRLSNKFKFFPRESVLEIGQSERINIQFLSDILGEFSETFSFSLQGSEEPLQCVIKGQVIGPTFHFDTKKIDFGIVSYDLVHTMTTVLVNTSNVDMNYKLYVPQDGTYVKREFEVLPAVGCLASGQSVEVAIRFTPNTVKVYNYTLAIDIHGVGEVVSSIPVTAECIVSSVRLPQRELAFGDCFLRYPYEQEMTLINQSNVVETKCTILPQPQPSKGVALYTADPETVVVPVGGSRNVKFTFQTEKLGTFKIPVVIAVAGSQEPPIQAALSCVSVGPKVETDKTELRWGNVECLLDSPRTLILTNTSLIPASCKIFLKMARSKYKLSTEEVVLQPHSEFELTVTANLDDTIVHEDELHIMVHEGMNLMIPLVARGIGTSIFCEQNIRLIDFGVQLTNICFERKIILENKGRRQQALRWTNFTNKEENANRQAKAKKLTKEGKRVPKSLMPLDAYFSVEPTEITLRPRTATTFTFKGSSPQAVAAMEQFLLESKVGKERGVKTIISTEIRAEVVDPLLTFSEKELDFVYSWEKGVEPLLQRKEIRLTNKTAIPLTFVLKVDVPFNLSSWEHTLAPEQSTDLSVEFDPMYRDDLTSHTVEKQLIVSYRAHPQKDSIPLRADILFPNLEFEASVVNFGCVLNDTTKTCKVRVKNWSKLDAAYNWIFIEDEGKMPGKGTKTRSSNNLSPSQIFDILPIRSVLKAGESEDIEFTMFGHTNCKLSTAVICQVDGGPEYKLTLQGEASVVTFSMDRDVVDFGEILYCERKDEQVIISNLGKVAFNFAVSMEELSATNLIEASPSSGKVGAGEKLKVTLRFRPGIPSTFAETVIFKIAHFDPVKVKCFCKGIFPAVAVTLPRHKRHGPLGEGKDKNIPELWAAFTSHARENIMHPDKSKFPPKLGDGNEPGKPSATSAVPPIYQPSPTDDYEDGNTSTLSLPFKGKEPSQIAIDVEMHRMAFCSHLADFEEKVQTLKLSSPKTIKSRASKGTIDLQDAADASGLLGVDKIVVANYLCDFGNVISGTSRKKVFKIMNASTSGPMSWVFDKQHLAGSGFSIDPDKVTKLPEAGVVDIVVKFLARGRLHLGRQTNTLPITMKNAPTVNLLLSVNVCMPDLVLSSDSIDFERVKLGCCKRMFVRLHNNTPVTTRWQLKKPGTSKDENKFTVYPMEGSVRAGQSVVVEIEYVPTEARKNKVTLTMKIDMNNKSKKTLMLMGEGVGTPIRFDPPVAEFGPVLPFSSGEDKVVTIFNDGDCPVELYSLDFDTSFKEEDAILQAVDIYEADGLCRAPVRNPGEPLPSFILDAYKAVMTNPDEESAHANADFELHHPPYSTENQPRDEDKQQDILVVGPMLSGVSTAASKLGKSLELPVLTIDGVVEDVAATLSDMGEIARRILNRSTPVEVEAAAIHLNELIEAAEKSKEEAIELYKKSKKGKAKEIPEDVLRTQAVIDLEEFKESSTLNANTLCKLLQERVKYAGCGYGIVLDGVSSKFANPTTVIAGVAKAFPNIVVSQIVISGGEAGYCARLASLHDAKTDEVDDIKVKLEEAAKLERAKEAEKIKSSRGSARRGSAMAAEVNSGRRESIKPESARRTSHSNIAVEEVAALDESVEVCLPVGDETWVDANTNMVMELSDDEFKSLENDQKEVYLKQIKYQRIQRLASAEAVLERLGTVWDEASAELKRPNSSEENETEEKDEDQLNKPDDNVMYYDTYISKVCTALVSSFSPSSEVPDGESVGSAPTPESDGEQKDDNMPNIPSNIIQIECEEDSDADAVFSVMKALLPAPLVPPPDKDALPPPKTNQIFRKPYPRLERKPVPNFRIIPYDGNSSSCDDASDTPEPNSSAESAQVFRWVIEGKSSMQFKLHYKSEVEGRNDAALSFEIVGTHQTYTLFATGICEVPHIQSDSRSVFMRRVKGLIGGQPPPQKRYISSDDFYSFGPLLRFKEPEWRIVPAEGEPEDNYNSVSSTNMDVIRICNNGRYKCTVDMGFDMTGIEEEEIQTFYVEPSTLELEEGETRDIKIWAFPKDAIEYRKTLVACISNNPQPVVYELSCWGVEPSVELSGPWEEAMLKFEAEIAEKKAEAKPDAKLIKEMESKYEQMKSSLIVDFDRILIERTDLRMFTMKNTCLLPVAWEIDAGDFKDSSNVTISPLSGIVNPGTSCNISVSFFSRDPMICTGNFTLRYSDHEGGLQSDNRVKSFGLGVQAEAYNIKAVSLTALGEQEGGNEIDMGKIRVGDYVTKKLKMGNRGKYKIGFKFNVRKPGTASLLKIVPSEGEIEPNAEVEIAVTFCSPDAEVNFKGNKDIRVLISEPLTGEQVEEFNLLLTAKAVFNKFRMQPAKGISFGAMRFDSDVKTKRIELRNEGAFEFTYVVCGAMAEIDEIDMFDAQTLACYAYATPPARRTKELGENYISRIQDASKSAAAGKTAKKDDKKKAPPAKGGKSAPADDSANKPVVFDPDELQEVAIPENPLEIGSFSASPRVGVLQPGECAGIDIMFNPAGCKTVRERLRVCVSGVNPADAPSQWARSFEVVGESCTPAIVTDDIHSIFEEQQVVHSLDEINTGSEEGAAVKVENIGIGKVVYSVVEKMLAFGPVMCCVPGGRSGSVERIRITNPTKIDVKVSFNITSANEVLEASGAGGDGTDKKGGKAPPKKDPKGKKGSVAEPSPTVPSVFTVQPEVWEIPPHEHRYVNIHFNPTEIKSYRSVFVASVEDDNTDAAAGTTSNSVEGSKSDKKLSFDLGGSGTMPCIAVEQPTERDSDGNLVIDFNRVHSDRVSTKSFILRNDGVMTSTCLFDMPPGSCFNFPSKDSSLTLNAGEKRELSVSFAPKDVANGTEEVMSSQVKISVLNNPYDKYFLKLNGTAYSCDAIIETSGDDISQEEIKFAHINLSQGPGSTSETILLRSRSDHPIKFKFTPDENLPKVFSCKPSVGHLGPQGTKEILVSFSADTPTTIESGVLSCSLQPIEYKTREVVADEPDDSEEKVAVVGDQELELRNIWDDSMVSIRPATDDDLKKIKDEEDALAAYEAKVEAEAKKGKKGKAVGPPPETCGLKQVGDLEDGTKMVQETVREPYYEVLEEKDTQTIQMHCKCSADAAKYSCSAAGQNIQFKPTFLFQSTSYKFTFKNESMIDMPVSWHMESAKRRGTRGGTSSSRSMVRMGTSSTRSQSVPNPFTISPDTCVVPPNTEQEFTIRFSPLEVDDFMYIFHGDTVPSVPPDTENNDSTSDNLVAPLRLFVKGEAKRPVCHFNITESPDYLLRRPPGMKNEVGLYAPIEATDMRVVEVESTGLRVRNAFRFSVVNPTNDNYEFKWDSMGDPSPFWRCALGAGMLFAGKSTEMIFEFSPEEDAPAESFYKFSLPTVGVSQVFLFAGKVSEPRVTLSTSKVDFHSVVLEGEGTTETLYIENKESIPFSFAFDKVALQNLEGPSGPILSILPRTGTVPPNSKFPVELLFRPQEEIHYNLNVSCEIRRKPNKLSVNIKGEGYAVHPLIQLEHSGEVVSGVTDHYITLKPAPHVNYADFGAVQVLDSITKTFIVTNNGKYNFDYQWDTDVDVMTTSNLSLSGGKYGGTLQKGVKMEYGITFAPQKEMNIDGAVMTFTVAGKFVYNIIVKGSGVQPAVRFSFMHYDFGSCFITSPGGNTVIEETVLRIVNHDPVNNIAVDCSFQKTRALWAECHPVVLEPGGGVDVPIRFAPRDVKEYAFVIPFVINGTGKVNVNVVGQGILPRLELVNAAQRRTNFGLVDVGSDNVKTITLVNKSVRALPVQLCEDDAQYGGSALGDCCVVYNPRNEFIIQPRDKATIQLIFSPNRRIPQFTEELMIRYAGITRKLLTVFGKAQGAEVSLDTDSLPFGVVVDGSRKMKKLSLENSGDLSLTFRWVESSFGPHFSISPLFGKLAPGNEVNFDVIFEPKFVDADIRQENIMLSIPGMSPLTLTCSGVCVPQPDDSIVLLNFESLVRKEQRKEVNLRNPTDKDWFISPSISGIHWSVPNEIKVPPKGSADLVITYFPLVMCEKPESEDDITDESGLQGQLFMALPDGTAQLYKLRGFSGLPESCGTVTVETSAKKHCMIPLKMSNWLSETQKFHIDIDTLERPSPATFFIAANAVEVAPHGVKDFQVRFNAYVEGTTKATVTFTNRSTGEYFFYDVVAKATSAEILEDIVMESSVRQSAKHLITIENPLQHECDVQMGTGSNPDDWWSCDSKCIRVKQLVSISGNPEGSFELEYRPLTPTNKPEEHLVTIMTKELGTFKYKVIVTATPSSVRQTLHFEVPLGNIQTETFLFKTYNHDQTTYNCSVRKPTFFNVNKALAVPAVTQWDGEDARLGVTFEPADIGTTHDILTVTSPEGGLYECELVGRCVPPMPLGPYNFNQGSAQDIPFRNCFNETCQWSFVVDSPHFKTSAATASVPAKSDGVCGVEFQYITDEVNTASTSAQDFITAKLFIRCDSKSEIPPWIIYLRGKVET